MKRLTCLLITATLICSISILHAQSATYNNWESKISNYTTTDSYEQEEPETNYREPKSEQELATHIKQILNKHKANGWSTSANATSIAKDLAQYWNSQQYLISTLYFKNVSLESAKEIIRMKVALMCCAIPDSYSFNKISLILESPYEYIAKQKYSGNLQNTSFSSNEKEEKMGYKTTQQTSLLYDKKTNLLFTTLYANRTEEEIIPPKKNTQDYVADYLYYIPNSIIEAIDSSIIPLYHLSKQLPYNGKAIATTFIIDTVKLRQLYNRAEKEVKEYCKNRFVFSKYAEPKLTDSLTKWEQKGEFETTAQYMERVNKQSRANKIEELLKILENKYIEDNKSNIEPYGYTIDGKYDADNQVFKIKISEIDKSKASDKRNEEEISYVNKHIPINDNEINHLLSEFNTISTEQSIKYERYSATISNEGSQIYIATSEKFSNLSRIKLNQEILVPVPIAEAASFKQNFEKIKKTPKYGIANDTLTLAELVLTYNDKTYKYTNDAVLAYNNVKINTNFAPVSVPVSTGIAKGKQSITESNITVGGLSDIDTNIPHTGFSDNTTFVLIIANEDYEYVKDVPFAGSDGAVFKNYCKETLGIPEKHIRFVKNATLGDLLNQIGWLTDISKAHNGEASIIFYYAGHGIPDESSKDAYLLPIDGNGNNTRVCYKLGELYSVLSNCKAKRSLVFLDACFSGAERGGGMLASARAVSISAKKETPSGNIIVFSAAQGDETAYPYNEKGHGLFTYYLLKKIQESSGNVTLGELADYVTKNVSRESLINNNKSQTPSVIPSANYHTNWRDIKLAQ